MSQTHLPQSHRLDRLRRSVLAASGWILAACTQPAGPAPANVAVQLPTAGYSADRETVAASLPHGTRPLHRRTTLNVEISVSQPIGAAGGMLELPALGVSLTIPAGALEHETLLTLTAVSGDIVAYTLSPQSLVLAQPARLRQTLSVTAWQEGRALEVVPFGGEPRRDGRSAPRGSHVGFGPVFGTDSFSVSLRRFTGYLLSMA